jgi:hypothetical protein
MAPKCCKSNQTTRGLQILIARLTVREQKIFFLLCDDFAIVIRVSAVEVSQRLGIPVLDPALLSVRTAEMLVSALDYR